MQARKRQLLTLLMYGALAACDGGGDLIRNPMIDRWCGQRPCNWEVTQGEVNRVGSWHTDDYAVELLGDDTVLSQANHSVDAEDVTAFGFTMIADVARNAHVYLELDFLDDGSPEYSKRIPESHWQRREFCITPPDWFTSVRFSFRKDGPGHVVIAELRGFSDVPCTEEAIDLLNRPDHAVCETDDECLGGVCKNKVCGRCALDKDCETGLVCGLDESDSHSFHACVEAGSSPPGHVCESGAQCNSSHCSAKACTE